VRDWDYGAVGKPRVKRTPLYLVHELAGMFGMSAAQLIQMMSVAKRKGKYLPKAVMLVGNNRSTSPKRKYYTKEDFIKFLNDNKETT
jgi:hypothetical protein